MEEYNSRTDYASRLCETTSLSFYHEPSPLITQGTINNQDIKCYQDRIHSKNENRKMPSNEQC